MHVSRRERARPRKTGLASRLVTGVMITAEFLPASLLTPMAASLSVTEGMADKR